METDISSIKEDYKYEKVEHPFQIFGWVMMGVFLILGLVGLLGDSGILNEKKIETSEFSLEYARFLRVEKSGELKIILKGSKDHSVVKIARDYFNNVKISEINPLPEETITGEDIIYSFKSGENGLITFYIDPLKKGNIDLNLTINEKKVHISQFIYF